VPDVRAIHAQEPGRIDIPAGDLAGALDTLARTFGTQLIYQADQLRLFRQLDLRQNFAKR